MSRTAHVWLIVCHGTYLLDEASWRRPHCNGVLQCNLVGTRWCEGLMWMAGEVLSLTSPDDKLGFIPVWRASVTANRTSDAFYNVMHTANEGRAQ